MRARRWRFILASALLPLTLAACATSQQSFTPLKSGLTPKPANAEILVFEGTDLPTRPYEKVAKLDVHLEVTHFVRFGLAEALPKLKTQAREAGGDAIIEIKETKSRVLETAVYHVRATAIRFTD